ncbi:MAG: 3-phosphoshikimate 1-carboxyvinyltransferase [Chitinivibrionales bacterium]|nr:3-phosphoshikimate 1-carboxyvinyltransferase [Chitinivibrionales bacterium]
MKWKISPSRLSGEILIPPSKSHTIRALLIATLADGTSTIRNALLKGDGESALNAARCLGARVETGAEALCITGIGDNFEKGQEHIYTGNSGTATRLFTAAAALGSRVRTFDGDASLRSRPMQPLLEALQRLGASYTANGSSGDLPFSIHGPLTGGHTRVSGITSQFLSSLLLAAPLAQTDSTIEVADLHEKPYAALTLWWLEKLGIRYVANDAFDTFIVTGSQSYRPIDLTIPGDFSSATFAAIAAPATGSPLRLQGLDFNDPQGDKQVFSELEKMGAQVGRDSGAIVVGPGSALSGCEIDLNNMPDALPSFAVLGCIAQGTTHIVNVAQARIKETDRIAVMCTELRKMGADIAQEQDGLLIKHSNLHGAEVNGHHDHRVVMALAVAALAAKGETTITTAEAAEVTYPGFAEDFRRLGADITEREE